LRTGYMLTPTDVVKFNSYVEEDFWEQVDLIFEILVKKENYKIVEAVEYIYEKFDMDETILDARTIKKHFYRYRVSLKAA
jgi:hypothetical protein